VLLLGAGFVTKPTAEILGNSGIKVIVGMLLDSTHEETLLIPFSLQDVGECTEAGQGHQECLRHQRTIATDNQTHSKVLTGPA